MRDEAGGRVANQVGVHIVLERRGGVRTTQADGAIVVLDRVEDVC